MPSTMIAAAVTPCSNRAAHSNSGCLGDLVAGAAFPERVGPPDELVQHPLGEVVVEGIVRHGLALAQHAEHLDHADMDSMFERGHLLLGEDVPQMLHGARA